MNAEQFIHLLYTYDWSRLPPPLPSFVDGLSALEGVDFKGEENLVIVELCSGFASNWHQDAFRLVENRRVVKSLKKPVKDLTFVSFNVGAAGKYHKILSELIEPRLVVIPTYICYKDGVEISRLQIRRSTDALCLEIEKWITRSGLD